MSEQTERAPLRSEPLVLHVIPTARARGAQREARALADRLDLPGARRHQVVSLFDGPEEVATDISLRHPGRGRPAEGFDPRMAWRLRSLLRRHDPATVVAHGSEPLKYLVLAMVGARRPLAYYAIGTYSGPPARHVQVALWSYLARRADVVIAEGEEVRDECTRLLGVPAGRVHFVPNGRDPDMFRPHPPTSRDSSRTPVVCFVGALTRGKAPDRFVEVAARLRSRSLPFRAEMLGDGPLRQEIAGAAASAGVDLLGSRSDVAERMREADVLVFPSRPAGEGMPGTLIEAGMSGLPVVATAVAGVSTIVEAGVTGFVVEEPDLVAMTEATAQLLEDEKLRSKMGQAARERCTGLFSLDEVARQWLDLLQPLVDSASTRRVVR